jgi:hypothetical protein
MAVSLTLFHGTNHEHAESIRSSGFVFTKTRYLSFGEGVYFYSTLQRAHRYADEDRGENARVLEVNITVPEDRLRVFSGSEVLNDASFFERVAKENSFVLDLTRDDGVFVVRPQALHLLTISHIHG